MEGDCNVYAHSSLWMRPTGEWSINAKMVYRIIYHEGEMLLKLELFQLMEQHRSDAHDLKNGNVHARKRWKNALRSSMNSA